MSPDNGEPRISIERIEQLLNSAAIEGTGESPDALPEVRDALNKWAEQQQAHEGGESDVPPEPLPWSKK